MRKGKFNPDELKGVRSAPVPGFANVRADEGGNVWKWNGTQWVRVGIGSRLRTSLRNDAGKKVAVKLCWMVCAAWHGVPQKGWSVVFGDGNRKNLKPWNLTWCAKQQTGVTPKLSKWQKEEIRERAKAGETLTSLAAEYKVSVATVCMVCKSDGKSVAATAQLTADEKAELIRQRKAGSKIAALAVRFGRTPERVGMILRQEREKENQPCSPSD